MSAYQGKQTWLNRHRREVIQGRTIDVPPEIRPSALVRLAKAYDDARAMDADPWEFAVEVERLIGRACGGREIAAPHWDRRMRTLYLGDRIREALPGAGREPGGGAVGIRGGRMGAGNRRPVAPTAETCPGMRLRDTIRRLNANQSTHLLRFRGDGTGRRILWEMVVLQVDAAARPVRKAA